MKKKKGGGDGPNWMDTYGDMVTLLLCFFVLLYSMSTVSEDKWRAIVQSFNPNSLRVETVTGGNEGPLADPYEGIGSLADPSEMTPEELEAAMEAVEAALAELFESLSQYVEDNGMGQNIEVTKGDGYIFISFNDAIFFGGDSYVLLDTGRQVLDAVSGALNNAAAYIDEIRIMGHTAQALPDRPNNPDVDRFLASNRATVTLVYIQERCPDIDPARLVSMGYGQFRPIAPNDNEEHRSHNRRVEIMVTGVDLLNKLGDSIQQYETMRTGDWEMRTDSSAEE